MIRKILAAIFITAGLAAMSVPLFYQFYESHKIDGLIEQFEKSVEQEHMDDDKKEEEIKTETETADTKAPVILQTARICSTDIKKCFASGLQSASH